MPIDGISSTDSPYTTNTYSAASNDKNTLSITSYFKLLAAQLANQDMTNPMSTSDMMNQMSQMAMVQSLTAMTESIQTSSTLSTQSYAASMVGQKVVYNGSGYQSGSSYVAEAQRTGTIESVNFSGTEPTIRISGDPNDYPLDAILQVIRSKEEDNSKTATAAENAATTKDTEATTETAGD